MEVQMAKRWYALHTTRHENKVKKYIDTLIEFDAADGAADRSLCLQKKL